jgi:hypothetical protein
LTAAACCCVPGAKHCAASSSPLPSCMPDEHAAACTGPGKRQDPRDAPMDLYVR